MPMETQGMDTAELLSKVRKIEIKTKGLSKHIFSGEYHSAFKGRGMSFSEVRSYQYGDDVRNIDWNVTARTGEPHVKVFEEERELTVMLLVDFSQSAYFGSTRQFKHEIMTEICAVLAFSAINNNDKVGIILFTDTIELFVPPKKGRQHILRIIRELIDFQPKGKGTKLETALQYFNNVIKKRSICFLVSDFMDRGFDTAMRIAARKHDMVGIHLFDPRETELPDIGLIRALDPERDEVRWIDTHSKALRDLYAEGFREQSEYARNVLIRSGAEMVSISTRESYVNALMKFFQKRMK
jgi:uncharacterized protein (DUF58 family)